LFSLSENVFCTSYITFVTMRAMTGIGGGILLPNAVALQTAVAPPGTMRNFTLAVFAASPPIGAMAGALLVGIFFELAEWKWFFVFM
jgi:MFS family permease